MFETYVLAGTGYSSSCKDRSDEETPTCGWVLDEDGNNIPDSQGFCCDCSMNDGIIGSIPWAQQKEKVRIHD